MAKSKNFSETVTQTELIAIAHDKYDALVRDWLAKKTGDPEKDALIDHYIQPYINKCEILNQMYKFETGMKLFED